MIAVTQEGCKQEAALYLWWTERIPAIITIAALPTASAKKGIHSLDIEQIKCGRIKEWQWQEGGVDVWDT